jgi:hypothetical protein
MQDLERRRMKFSVEDFAGVDPSGDAGARLKMKW